MDEHGTADRRRHEPRFPARATPEAVERAIALWEPRAGRKLRGEDAREIIENLTGFFQVLQEWERAERNPATKQPT